MGVTVGDIKEITYNHPTVGSGILYPKSNEDSTFDLGGYRGNDDSNQLDGGGRMIAQLNQVRWGFEGNCTWDMNVANELENLVELAGSPEEADFTFTHINGSVYTGKGRPVGDLQGSGNTGMINLKISGGKRLKKIA